MGHVGQLSAGGELRVGDESTSFRWAARHEASELANEAYAIRVLDALRHNGAPMIRQHDGRSLLYLRAIAISHMQSKSSSIGSGSTSGATCGWKLFSDAMTKTYRSPVQDVLVPISGFLFLILSPTPALAGPGKGGTTGEVLGVLVAILSAGLGLALIICQASNRLIVAENGLTYRHNLRTRQIAWTDIQAVGVMRAKSGGSWWWLQVQTHDQQTAIKSVTGTRKYVDGVAGEIRTQVDGQRQS